MKKAALGRLFAWPALAATLSQRHDSQPGEGLKKNDTPFVTGVSLRLDRA